MKRILLLLSLLLSAAAAPRKQQPRRVAPLDLDGTSEEAIPAFRLADLSPPSSSSSSPAATAGAPLLPPGRVLQLPPKVRPIALSFAPSRRALLLADGAVHRNNKYAVPMIQQKEGWLMSKVREVLGIVQPYPVAYLVTPAGGWLRTLELVDRETLARGLAESEGGELAFSFYQGPGVEVWDKTLCVAARVYAPLAPPPTHTCNALHARP